ncbi:MAG: alkaline shock response membrane anchor protein AmaP [Thermoanaerobacteraceae bacterium]|nr:alkaline shock response membrane anchor protein AmaP [Thermoanaerobacteraceae bacterium]
MKFFDRIVIATFSLLTAIVSVIFIIISTDLISLRYFSTSLSMVYGRWETGAFGLVLLIFSLCFLVYALKSKRVPETIVRDNDLGKVCITLNAVESIVQKVIRDVEDVKESRIYIKKQEDGVSVALKITVNYDVIIPELTSELQKTIKDYVESTAGILIKNVRISVSNVSNQIKQK